MAENRLILIDIHMTYILTVVEDDLVSLVSLLDEGGLKRLPVLLRLNQLE